MGPSYIPFHGFFWDIKESPTSPVYQNHKYETTYVWLFAYNSFDCPIYKIGIATFAIEYT